MTTYSWVEAILNAWLFNLYSVMGPSGSGKSTLLNALACRLDKEVSINGEVRLNGRKYSTTELKAMSGYVMQDDLLNAHLTVEETLWYSAELRLPNSFTTEQRQQRVEEALVEMGLVHARNVIVGNSLKKGISGGERKRLCVAIELLTHPLLLFLDEPTSGLDSVTALSLCEKLKELADSGKTTVVCTIHQPQSKIFKLFSNLILLRVRSLLLFTHCLQKRFHCCIFVSYLDISSSFRRVVRSCTWEILREL